MAGKRFRAWILGKSTRPVGLAEDIENTMIKPDMEIHPGERPDRLIIVRADVVAIKNEAEMQVLVAVDARNKTALGDAERKLRQLGLSDLTTFRVYKHFPHPPHNASTYVTEAELEADYVQEFAPFGRHPKSPGRNAWG